MKDRSATRRRRASAGIATLAALLVISGCMMGQDQPQQVTWDLTGSPIRADVGWPAERAGDWTYHLEAGTAVTFQLPDGKTFHGRDLELFIEAPTNRILTIAVHTQPMTVDAAVAYASGLMAEWQMEGGSLDAWAEGAKRAQAADRNLPRTVRQTPGPISEKGPIISIEMLNSFGRELPTVVDVTFYWPDAPSVGSD